MNGEELRPPPITVGNAAKKLADLEHSLHNVRVMKKGETHEANYSAIIVQALAALPPDSVRLIAGWIEGELQIHTHIAEQELHTLLSRLDSCKDKESKVIIDKGIYHETKN
jgi:hypothetical protein